MWSTTCTFLHTVMVAVRTTLNVVVNIVILPMPEVSGCNRVSCVVPFQSGIHQQDHHKVTFISVFVSLHRLSTAVCFSLSSPYLHKTRLHPLMFSAKLRIYLFLVSLYPSGIVYSCHFEHFFIANSTLLGHLHNSD